MKSLGNSIPKALPEGMKMSDWGKDIVKIPSQLITVGYVHQWWVKSDSNPHNHYKVSLRANGDWSCSCKAWTTSSPRKNCKHIKRIKSEAIFDGNIPLSGKMTKMEWQEVQKTVMTENQKERFKQEIQAQRNALIKVLGRLGMELNKLTEMSLDEMKQLVQKLIQEGIRPIYFTDDAKLMCGCTNEGIEMEANWGCFRCPKCNYTISEEDYYTKLNKNRTQEIKYPV